MSFFLGKHQAQLENGRIRLPARYRGELEPGIVIIKGQEFCLCVYTKHEFSRITKPLRAAPFTSRQVRDYVRILFSSADDQIPDKDLSIAVGDDLCEYASLSGECLIIGVGNRLEIWNPEAWNSYFPEMETSFALWPKEMPPEASGRLAPSLNLTVIQNTSQTSSAIASTTVEMGALVRELSTLIEQARRDGLDETSEEVTALTAAHDAAAQGNERAVISNLRKVSAYIATLAKDIGVPVVVGLIKQRFGIE